MLLSFICIHIHCAYSFSLRLIVFISWDDQLFIRITAKDRDFTEIEFYQLCDFRNQKFFFCCKLLKIAINFFCFLIKGKETNGLEEKQGKKVTLQDGQQVLRGTVCKVHEDTRQTGYKKKINRRGNKARRERQVVGKLKKNYVTILRYRDWLLCSRQGMKV